MRSDRPVLAELSGGMDSSTIVCTADRLVSQGSANLPQLDTVSFYDDTEPNWDERPFFMRVEEQRDRPGYHIDASPSEPSPLDSDNAFFLAAPSSRARTSAFTKQFCDCVASGAYRVLLSGIGGDEITGGVPTPLPEMADLLVSLRIKRLARQLVPWALAKKKPITHLLFHTMSAFLPAVRSDAEPPSWLHPQFVQRNGGALRGYQGILKLFGPLPSFQANMFALDSLRRQLGCTPLPSRPPFEKRYPYLDRDFLAFCYAIPREQLVRPYQRRSLMRRAMAGIVPEEILHRKRKAFVRRRLAATLSEASRIYGNERNELVAATMGIIEPQAFLTAMQEAGRGNDVALVPLLRAMALEEWLRSLSLPILPTTAFHFQPPGSAEGIWLRDTRFLGREQPIRKGGE
jgi:asparagine synthase (glutamine-hydrolysing)